jgi:hypothetical protein
VYKKGWICHACGNEWAEQGDELPEHEGNAS